MSDNGGRESARRGDGLTRRTLLRGAGAAAWTLPVVTVGMAAPAMAATPEPVPEVGDIRHLCGGAHTFAFIIPVTGLPPNTLVELEVEFTPGGTVTEEQVTDGSGAATFRFVFPRTGPPIRCRELTVDGYRVLPMGTLVPLEGTYEGCCP